MPGRVNSPSPADEGFQTAGTKPEETAEGTASGRIRHDEKITVYVSSDELIALENARLTLRRAGIAVDRGRIVRAAIASGLADLDDKGPQADIVARLGAL
ncbi:MAG: hypothetical protein FWF25_03660 [Propionibacteriaceae bacterium]|nr:hypothetical protein [Propionibacteriaceae bacterium]